MNTSERINPYQVLQIPQDAPYQVIRQRYRHLSKLVHPDKHSIQNYQIAQAKFKQIDEAYKSISSSLRRYIYKHYGSIGINILENNPFMFSKFQKADLEDPIVLNELNQFMVYCLYQEHAATEVDKSKLRTKSVLMLFTPLNQINQLPSMQRCQFSYETSLPDFWGMTHTISINHISEGLNTQTKSALVIGTTSSSRITQNLMLNIQQQISGQKHGLQIGFDRSINNNLVLHFIPVNMENGQMQAMQFGADFHRDNYYISAMSDLQNHNIQIGSSPSNKQVTKSIKLGFDGDSVVVSPIYERQITEKLRIFIQMQIKTQRAGANATNLTGGFIYGYRLKIYQELKLQLASFVGGAHSNLQINIISPKFKANIPIFCHTDIVKYQLFKLGIFVGVYLSFQLYSYYARRTERTRRRIQYQNYNRISVDKGVVAKNNSDFADVAAESKQLQIKHSGLVILLAYIGSSDSINKAAKKIRNKINIKKRTHEIASLQQSVKKLREQIQTIDDDYKQQIYEITESVQAKVKGSQLLCYKVEELKVNPCLNQKQSYKSLTVYYLRGKVEIQLEQSSKGIVIGNLQKKYRQPWYEQFISWLKNKMIN